MRIYHIALIIMSAIIIMAFSYRSQQASIMDQSVVEVLEQLGADYTAKKPNTSIAGVSAEVGRSLIEDGFAPKPGGGKTGKQSKHFVCTSCHNTKREDPDLRVSDPAARLEYAVEHDMPFLQATTLYGAVNRDTYYNGDYEKKYGDLVHAARNDVRGAIQLCATECAQGRALKDWELESILAYMWEQELQMTDLDLSSDEQMQISNALAGQGDASAAKQLINSKYLHGSPATFIPPPADRKAGVGLEGDPKSGMQIYMNSCLHCHKNGEYSYLFLDDHKITHKHLNRKADGYSPHSIYQVTRWGVPTKSGKNSYMPQYTEERMSNQQLADLRAYIRERAE